MNIVEHISYYKLEHLLGIWTGEVLLNPQVVLCLPIFWWNTRLISRVVVPARHPISNGGVFLFYHILPSICYHLNFCSQPFWLVWNGISGLFWFAFHWSLRMLNISLGASQPFSIHQLRIFLFSSVCTPFLMGLFGFLESIFLNSLYILDISPLSDLG